jgi:hypothetical protein
MPLLCSPFLLCSARGGKCHRMDRRAFLKLAAGLSGALGLGLLSRRPGETVAAHVESLTNAELERIYNSLVRDGAFGPVKYNGEWVWISVDPFPPRYEFRDGEYHRVYVENGERPEWLDIPTTA